MTAQKVQRNPPWERDEVILGHEVYVLDAWNDTDQRSVVAVFATRLKATRALRRLLTRPGDWYAGIVKRTIQ